MGRDNCSLIHHEEGSMTNNTTSSNWNQNQHLPN